MLQLLALSVALAIDAATIAATVGAAGARRGELVRAAGVFGLFQGGMAGLGALIGAAGAGVFGTALPIAAGGLLIALGSWVAFGPHPEEGDVTIATWGALLALGLATSIDALASGVALPSWPVPVALSVAAIGVVTAAMCLLAGAAGAKAASLLDQRTERIAGVVLIVLGLWTCWT